MKRLLCVEFQEVSLTNKVGKTYHNMTNISKIFTIRITHVSIKRTCGLMNFGIYLKKSMLKNHKSVSKTIRFV